MSKSSGGPLIPPKDSGPWSGSVPETKVPKDFCDERIGSSGGPRSESFLS